MWAVYEPLTFHRTAALLDAFADALAEADAVAVADIWAGRDPDTTVALGGRPGRGGRRRAARASRSRRRARVEATAAWLAGEVRSGDAVLVMGGGRSYRIGELLLERPGGPMTVSYPQGDDLLEAFMKARKRYDGRRVRRPVRRGRRRSCSTRSARRWRATTRSGHTCSKRPTRSATYDLAIERHWVSGDTVLAAWHASWNRRTDEATVRQAGFLAAEVGGDGRIVRLRLWTVTREHLAG